MRRRSQFLAVGQECPALNIRTQAIGRLDALAADVEILCRAISIPVGAGTLGWILRVVAKFVYAEPLAAGPEGHVRRIPPRFQQRATLQDSLIRRIVRIGLGEASVRYHPSFDVVAGCRHQWI